MLKNRNTQTITIVWTKLHDTFKKAAVTPNFNEIPNEFIQALDENHTSYQLVPTHTHRRNLSERAIQTWKSFQGGNVKR